MYQQFYKKLSEEQVKAYFDRIHMEYDPNRALDRDYLDEITRAQLRSIPFDCADVWANNACPSLEAEDLFEKIVTNRRGGYCFELNTLFCTFLNSVGFDCYIVIVHLYRPDSPFRAPAHCAVIANIDGEQHFVDVGFGGPVPDGAVKLGGEKDNGYYSSMNDFYTVVGYDDENGNYFPRFTFKNMPCKVVEMEPLNFHVSQRPGSLFAANLSLNLRMDDGFASIAGSVFKYRNGAEEIEKQIESEEEAKELAAKYFGFKEGGLPTRPFDR